MGSVPSSQTGFVQRSVVETAAVLVVVAAAVPIAVVLAVAAAVAVEEYLDSEAALRKRETGENLVGSAVLAGPHLPQLVPWSYCSGFRLDLLPILGAPRAAAEGASHPRAEALVGLLQSLIEELQALLPLRLLAFARAVTSSSQKGLQSSGLVETVASLHSYLPTGMNPLCETR